MDIFKISYYSHFMLKLFWFLILLTVFQVIEYIFVYVHKYNYAYIHPFKYILQFESYICLNVKACIWCVRNESHKPGQWYPSLESPISPGAHFIHRCTLFDFIGNILKEKILLKYSIGIWSFGFSFPSVYFWERLKRWERSRFHVV